MAGRIKVELDRVAVSNQLLKSAGMESVIDGICAKIAAAAKANSQNALPEPGEFSYDVKVGKYRVRGLVWTDNFAAMRAEAVDRALTRAVDAGRS